MSSERPEEYDTRRDATIVVRGETAGDQAPKPKDSAPDSPPKDHGAADDDSRTETTVLVRGEMVRDQGAKSPPKDAPSKDSSAKDASAKDSPAKDSPAKDSPAKDSPAKDSAAKDSAAKDSSPKDKEKSPRKEVSEAKSKMQTRLPSLDDDSEVGVQKEQVVIRDGKADLAFTGTLVASAAPPSGPKGQWQEYRIYETTGGKHVFSKVTRSVFAEDADTHEADVFDPSPSSVPSQLLRSARDLARSRPLTWMDAAVAFFGYDPLAKALYRKLSGQFEEHIT